MRISLAGPSYAAKSVVAAAQETINWYPETLGVGDEPRKQVLVGRPGLKLFATLTPAKIRCLWAGGGRLFCIHGNKQSEINSAGVPTAASQTVAATAGVSPDPAQIFSNGHQLMIVSGGLVYVDNGTGPEPARFSLFGLVDTDGTTTVYWTETTPGTSDIFTAQMVGQTMRIGDGDYLVTSFINGGSVATYAPCSVGTTVCALAGGAEGQTVAYQAQGLQPQRISTFAQEQQWNAPGFNARDAVSYPYLDAGHLFWVINFWAEQQTWVYDVTEKLWHERKAFNPATHVFARYQPWFHAFIPEWGAGGKHIVGDPSTGKLYEQSLNFYDDDGVVIQYLRAFPHLLDEDKYLFHHRFELFMETGTVVAPNPEMLVALDWSSDRGHTFPTGRTVTQTSGLPGDYNKRIVWRRLGRSRDRVYRVGVQGRGKVALVDAFLEATPSEIA